MENEKCFLERMGWGQSTEGQRKESHVPQTTFINNKVMDFLQRNTSQGSGLDYRTAS
jgi:hypothetical protein